MTDRDVVRDSPADSSRESWLEWRRGGIGGSDIAALMGISSWSSPWSVWADKCGLLPPEDENDYMEFGRYMEPAIPPWFEDKTGLHVTGQQAWCTSQEMGKSWARATPDGFVVESEPDECLTLREWEACLLGTFEIKTTGPGKRWDPVPPYYQAQGQWQMFVTGLPKCWFAVLHGRRLEVYELDRDDADIEFMVERAEAFWRDHVLKGVPPATDASDATTRALAAVYAESSPDAVEVEPWAVERWQRWVQLRKEAEATEKDAANSLRAALATAEEGRVNGHRVVSLRPQTRRTTCRECGHVTESDPFRVLRYHSPKESR